MEAMSGQRDSFDRQAGPHGLLSPQARSLWAKTGSGESSHLWSPLYVHLLDSSFVAGLLWDEWLGEAVRRDITRELGGNMAAARALACWLAGVHDIGKATPSFQSKVRDRAERVMGTGLAVPSMRGVKPYSHAWMGELIMRRWLSEERGWADYDRGGKGLTAAIEYASVVGGHHGAPPSSLDLKEIDDHQRHAPNEAMGNDVWREVQREMLEFVSSFSGFGCFEETLMRARLSTTSLVLLNGIVIMADWIASNADFFPLVGSLGSVDDAERRAREGWRRLALPGPWHPVPADGQTPDALFRARFPDLPASARLREVQRAALGAAVSIDEPGLIIIEAPMGSGKTEASLLCAEVLASRFSEGGVCYLLPTMATSNAMFSRIERWLEGVPDARGHARQSMQLMHSKAELNADFTRLRHWGGTWMGDAGGTAEDVMAHEWFGGRKRGLLASFVVGTVDQLLMAALKARHVQLRQLGLAGKVVVIDEVHAYDAYMSVYLDRVLDYLGAYGAPVVLLSATLPPSRREQLVRAYRGEEGLSGGRTSRRSVPVPPAPRDAGGVSAYPLVTASSHDRGKVPTYFPCDRGDRRVDVEVDFLEDGDDALVGLLEGLLAEGGCACVLRDTVGRAQHTFDVLRTTFGDDLILVHSRFVAADRAANDERLLRLLGPASSERPQRLVVVGTQVLEQSLDIDFDVMVTDVAPIDLLLQRMGRLHRHSRGEGQSERPSLLRRARCFITGCDDWLASPPRMARGIEHVYESALLLRSVAALEARMADGAFTVTLPTDIAPLVEEVYEERRDIPEQWQQDYEKACKALDEHRDEKRRRAETWLLGRPQNARRCRGLDDWLNNSLPSGMGGDVERAAVRDTQDSIEVVVVQRREGVLYTLEGVSRDGAGTQSPSLRLGTGTEAPDDEAARLAARCTVSLPPMLCAPRIAHDVVAALETSGNFDGWQESRWLRGMLPLVLDMDGKGEIRAGGRMFRLRYTHERGLEATEVKVVGEGGTCDGRR